MNGTAQSDSPSRLYARYARGFTLIEIMVVIVIMSIMAAVVGPILTKQPDKARYKMASTNLKSISRALEIYQLQETGFPSTEEGLEAMVRPADAPSSSYSNDSYLLHKDDLLDPWGNRYGYVSPGLHGPFDLVSYGKDGQPGGEGLNADIQNW